MSLNVLNTDNVLDQIGTPDLRVIENLRSNDRCVENHFGIDRTGMINERRMRPRVL